MLRKKKGLNYNKLKIVYKQINLKDRLNLIIYRSEEKKNEWDEENGRVKG